MRHVLQTGLEVEMAEHLGYERGEAPPGGVGNARNGAYDKTVTTEIGEVEVRIRRDRRGSFEPSVVPKYQRRLDGLAGNVISLYAKGLTTGDRISAAFPDGESAVALSQPRLRREILKVDQQETRWPHS